MTREQQLEALARECPGVIEQLKEATREQGLARGHEPCGQYGCPWAATMRVHWPTVGDKPYPVYCESHGRWALKVLEALGVGQKFDRLPAPKGASGAARKILVEP